MYLVRTPELIKPFFKDLLWSVPNANGIVHLTFDDGPIAEVTPWVLDRLKEFNAKATFFCIGRNAEREPGILARIREEGHSIGNHTYDHRNGWKTSQFSYLKSVQRCRSTIESELFRPPYGRITREQVIALRRHFRIVMWEVLSADFDRDLTGEQCYRNVMENVKAGSIVVFHDSLKAWDRLRIALPRVLYELAEKGFRSEALPERIAQPLIQER